MEQSSQYLPEITNRLAGQAPSPLAESTVKFLSLGWFQRWGRMMHLRSVIGHVTEWASQGFSRKKGSLDSSSVSPGSLHWAHMHPAHSIPHSCCRWAISPLSIFTQIFSGCAKKDVGTYSECLPSERVCPCKQGCMRAHISEIRVLLCRCVSNPEPFKMLIFVWKGIKNGQTKELKYTENMLEPTWEADWESCPGICSPRGLTQQVMPTALWKLQSSSQMLLLWVVIWKQTFPIACLMSESFQPQSVEKRQGCIKK